VAARADGRRVACPQRAVRARSRGALGVLACGWLALGAVGVGALAGGRVAAAAGTRDAAGEIKSLNKQALDAFDNLNFDQAKTFLEQALATAAAAGLGRDPLAARTHLNFGMLWIAGFQKHDEGVDHFRSALKIQPDIAPPAGLFNPETQAAFDETKAAFKPEARPDGTAAAKPAPGRRPAPPAATAPPPTTPPPSPPAPPAVASDRKPASAPTTPPAQAGVPPAESSGKAGGKAGAKTGGKTGGVVDSGGTVPEEEEEEEAEGPGRGILVFVGVGSGFGTAKGHLEANQNVMQGAIKTTNNSWSGGLAASRLAHLSIGAGYLVAPSWLVSLDVRIQLVTGTTSAPGYTANGMSYPARSPPGTAIAVFARSQWYLAPGPVRPFLSGGIGAGYIRQVVSLKDYMTKGPLTDCGSGRNEQCVDTVAGGPLLFAAGGGVAYDLHSLVLLASLTANVGVPQLMLNLDLVIGLGMRF
jgi:hypothetical protein